MLEIIGFDIEGCRIAQNAGAQRIELCASPALGGTTPSRTLIQQAQLELNIPMVVMVRPRGGDFVYHASEFIEMQDTIAYCKSIGCAGVVFGILDAQNQLDIDRNRQLVQRAQPMQTVFHRAFDQVNEPLFALEQIIRLGFTRILTSGQEPTALEGAALIQACIGQAARRITVMPGSGVTSHNILTIKALTGAQEFHASGKLTDAATGKYLGVDVEEVVGMARLLK
jgi:copper homeostasis protein